MNFGGLYKIWQRTKMLCVHYGIFTENTSALSCKGIMLKYHMIRDIRFPTMRHFDKCKLIRAYAASF